MSDYRTAEQFEEIIESITNGNWTQGADECVEYGFYANDLLKAYDNSDYSEDTETLRDLIELIELATRIRYTQ